MAGDVDELEVASCSEPEQLAALDGELDGAARVARPHPVEESLLGVDLVLVPQRPVAAVDQQLDVVDPRHVEPVRDRGRGRRRLEQRPEAAAVIDVRMGDHDVAEVGRLEPERRERGEHGRRRRAGDTRVDE